MARKNSAAKRKSKNNLHSKTELRREADRLRKQSERANESAYLKRKRRNSELLRRKKGINEETYLHSRIRREKDRLSHGQARAEETPEQSQNRRDNDRLRTKQARYNMTEDERNIQNEHDRIRMSNSRKQKYKNWNYEAFNYNCDKKFNESADLSIGEMIIICAYCQALKFPNEATGMCCSTGKVHLEPFSQSPQPLFSYLSGTEASSAHFMKFIRQYNACFQMTSFGATNVVNYGGFMPTFKVQGQVYHQIGSLLPPPNESSKFLQIYFIGDKELEIDQRFALMSGIKREIISELQRMFDEHNQLIKLFKSSLDRMPSDDYQVIIRPDKRPSNEHERRFNAPTIDEVAIVIVGTEFESRDIIIQKRDDSLKRVTETHRSYDALQYPILFPRGEDGYHFNLRQINPKNSIPTTKKVSAMDYYAYRIMARKEEDNHLLKCKRLFQQFLVDMYAKIESERLLYIRLNQKKLRVDNYIHLKDAISVDGKTSDLGQMVILPSSFIGSPRHMHQYAQDGMTYVRKFGRPDLFITFTCNPNWAEISELLLPGQSSSDRPDIVARVFKQKLQILMKLITKYHVYGKTVCWMYTIEWQKRGLPHAHILIWLENKLKSDQIDSIISAEIPDPSIDPELHKIVCKHMIHGPCGSLNPNSPCMKNGSCTKRYPREMVKETQTGNDSYPLYRRRSPEDGGQKTVLQKKSANIEIDNRWIVPYSPFLSKIFGAHINVEFCNSVKSIKYICNYINKGPDMATFGLMKTEDSINEIDHYVMGRYISSSEAVWKMLRFYIHDRYPSVIQLAVHLENGQRVYFTQENLGERTLHPQNTTLTAFFQLCQSDEFAATLLYNEVPKYYKWENKQFIKRKKGASVENHPDIRSTDTLGRVYTIHPNNAECFFLRMLLHNVKGPKSFNDLKTINGELCATYREACLKLGLLENDSHWNDALNEATLNCSPKQIRELMAIILTTCLPSNPVSLWENHKDSMSEDILRHEREVTNNFELNFSQSVYNESLILLENICILMNNKRLHELGLPSPSRAEDNSLDNDLLRETQYNSNELRKMVEENERLLNNEQKQAYDLVLNHIFNKTGGIIFVDAPGGTGKTFLLNLILARIRMENRIALAVASSGIASTLLDGGRTAHSTLKLPLNINQIDMPTCNIGKNTGMASVLQRCDTIAWDECPMAHKKYYEALDRTLKDLRQNDEPMGGTLLLLAGDFRQTLPVIPKSTAADELNACLKNSYLWGHVKTIALRTNMRVNNIECFGVTNFSQQLLNIGNGNIYIDPITQEIQFPENFCKLVSSIDDLIKNVFPELKVNFKHHDWLSERAILAPTNENVAKLNNNIQLQLPGAVMKYKSIDTVVDENEIVNYPSELLNSLEPVGMPPHVLSLKIGSPIILLRNLNPPRLCNGTRLAVKQLQPNVIEATIISGKYKGENVLIPRIPLIATDIFVEFKRLQFPIRLAFAMTINKAQGQTLNVCGINLEKPCFSHGQLYVACSRVGSPNNLYIYAPNERTKNIVHKKALE